MQNRPVRGDGETRANANGAATVTRIRSITQLASTNFVTDRHVRIVPLYFIKDQRFGIVVLKLIEHLLFISVYVAVHFSL
ncbi:hypothetical protein L596_025286 [Steinernema carpocapsae]|uniref:Uncharacterized protein n=1 Tax=Steinernema carpocapsae TaxID=34508 RepID=A0A4U5M7C2_STECR|nr:hypothetical protein L596_025286 [Steinernema carpocapsae]